MAITTHAIDTALGAPAMDLGVALSQKRADGNWDVLCAGATDRDGRISDWGKSIDQVAGVYRLTFHTGAYHSRQGQAGFYPEVNVVFELADRLESYHLPLLISPFGYSTYRGS